VSVLALILVLAIEQWRPFSWRAALESLVGRAADGLEHQFNAGQVQHGVIAWSLLVLPVLIVVGIASLLLAHLHWLLALVLHVGVLYFTMGFRQGSHCFTAIRQALADEDVPEARRLLARWIGRDCDALSRAEITRVSIEHALLGSHRLVFAVMFWYVLLPGPTGAILYRLSALAAERWGQDVERIGERFGRPARRVFDLLDGIPARLTASAFAIVGDFEDAVFCWRSQAAGWPDRVAGIILASGAGALGLRLGLPLPGPGGDIDDRPEIGLGDEPDQGHLDSTVGLIWRALVLWLGFILMVTLAHSLG
jgi:cobalamin biosynthesis protein CobD/CbiB